MGMLPLICLKSQSSEDDIWPDGSPMAYVVLIKSGGNGRSKEANILIIII